MTVSAIRPLTQEELNLLRKDPMSDVFKKYFAELQYLNDCEKADLIAIHLRNQISWQNTEKEHELLRKEQEDLENARLQKLYNENLKQYYDVSSKASFLTSSVDRMNAIACLAVLEELSLILKEFQKHFDLIVHYKKEMIVAQAQLDDVNTQWKNTLADLTAGVLSPSSITAMSASGMSPAVVTPSSGPIVGGHLGPHAASVGLTPSNVNPQVSSLGLPSDPATVSRYAPHLVGEYKTRASVLTSQYQGDGHRARMQARDELRLHDLYFEYLASKLFTEVTPSRIQFLKSRVRTLDDLYIMHQFALERAQEGAQAAEAAAIRAARRAQEVASRNRLVLGGRYGHIQAGIENNIAMIDGLNNASGYEPDSPRVSFS